LNLAGNVWEWVSDAHGVAEGMRSVRGRAWGAESALARTSQRVTVAPTDRDAQTGFRCAFTPPK
jgi:formylglycine-generating enzyme required for sulfatase activity